MSNNDWFQPLPLKEYLQINKRYAENVPEEVPREEEIGGLDIRCGPILQLLGNLEDNKTNYRGSMMLVIKDSGEMPTVRYKIGPANESDKERSIEGGEFPGTKYYEEDGYSFYRYNIELQLEEHEQKVKYFVNSFFKQSYQFFVPSNKQSMNVVSYSCNGFSLGTDTKEFKGSLWYDVLEKHSKNHYHVMLGGGDQVYCDSIKFQSKKLEEWLNEHNPIKKIAMPATPEMLSEFSNYYINQYLGWFGQGYLVDRKGKTLQSLFPLAQSQIPSVNFYDDHDIIDGFGSYHDSTMNQEVLSGLGNIAYKYYMIFQHQINPEEKLHLDDPSWILGDNEGPYIKQRSHSNYIRLGKEISLVGVDCRTERKLREVISPSTYRNIFTRLDKEIEKAPEVKHLLVMLGVPILYPRLVWLEWLLTSSLLKPIRKLAKKGIVNKGLVNEFDGSVELLDDLNDHWCSRHHKSERNYLIKKLIDFGSSKGVRVTILSGDVHLCCIGRLKTKIHHHHRGAHYINATPEEITHHNFDVLENPQYDPRLVFNVISSAIVNTPPPDSVADLLNRRSKVHHFNEDCDEDTLPIFLKEPTGETRNNRLFLNKRNWCDLIIANQSKHKEEVNNGIRRFPSPVLEGVDDELEEQVIDEAYIKYPLLPDSLVTTLHVEKKPSDVDSKTTDYELYIPRLMGKYILGQAKVKHLS